MSTPTPKQSTSAVSPRLKEQFSTPEADKAFIGRATCTMSGNFPACATFAWGVMSRLLTHFDVHRLYILGRIKGPTSEGLAEEVYVPDQRSQAFIFTSL